MNPRQRRGVMLMILAGLGAVGVFVAVVSYVGQVRAQVGDMRQVLQLTREVPANAAITATMVRRVEVPARWVPETAITDTSALRGKVAASELSRGAYLQRGMIISAPALEPNQREIAILINAETGVAGKIESGSVVDIYATFAGNATNSASCAVRLISQARVLDVGKLRVSRGNESESQVATDRVVPITFALSQQESLMLTYAESFAETVRLARIGPGSQPPSGAGKVCSLPGNASTRQGASNPPTTPLNSAGQGG